jgi:DNA-directed RNA polymerase subunit RPC12/RpoP
MYTFKCYQCKGKSRYFNRVGANRWEFAADAFSRRDETRTYECEHCSAENEIKNSTNEWMAIDLEASSR